MNKKQRNENYKKITTDFAFDKNQPCKKIKTFENGKPLYNNILECWKAHKEYKQCSSGLTHSVRNVLVLDIDTELTVEERCKLQTQLKPTYIVLNPKTNHLQFGFLYSETLFKKNNNIHRCNILAINDAARKILNRTDEVGDDNYTGWQCKNPFCDELDLIYFNENNKINILYYSSSSFFYNNTNRTVKSAYTKKSQSRIIHNAFSNNSRDYYIYTSLRTKIWDFMRSNKGAEPTYSWIYNEAQILNNEAAIKTGKGSTISDAEIHAICKCTGSWSISHFKFLEGAAASHCGGEARKVSLLVRKNESMLKWFQVQELKNLSQREIAKTLNISVGTVNKLLKEDKSYISIEDYIMLQELNNTHNVYTNLINDLAPYINKMYGFNTNNNISSSSIYNNTNRTVEDENKVMKRTLKKNLTSNVDYKKLYDKVAKYLVRHNHSMNPKWGNEEIEIANKILNKLGD